MPVFCIRKEKIDELKGLIMRLGNANQLQKLVDLPHEKRVQAFSKIVSKEEASLLMCLIHI